MSCSLLARYRNCQTSPSAADKEAGNVCGTILMSDLLASLMHGMLAFYHWLLAPKRCSKLYAIVDAYIMPTQWIVTKRPVALGD